MRATTMPALLGLLLLAPTAAAALSLRIETPPPVMPLAAAAIARYVLTADCEPTLPGGAPRTVHLWIERKPEWATIVVSPATVSIDCTSGTVEKDGALSITATPEAPAFAPATVEVGVAYEGGLAPANESGKASVPVQAAFFSILEAQVPDAIVTMAPGQDGSVALDLLNRGNGPTRVAFRLVNASEGIAVEAPGPVVLAVGGHARVDVPVRTAPASGLVNRVDVLNLDYAGAYAPDPTIAGDKGTVSIVVQTRRAPSPGPDLALCLVAVGAAVAARLTRPSA